MIKVHPAVGTWPVDSVPTATTVLTLYKVVCKITFVKDNWHDAISGCKDVTRLSRDRSLN